MLMRSVLFQIFSFRARDESKYLVINLYVVLMSSYQ